MVEARVTVSGEVRLGSTYVFTRQVFGRRVETNGEVTAYEPHTEYAWKATSGPFPLAGGNRLEEVDGGTRVTSWMEAVPGGFFALARPVLRRMVRRQLESVTDNLKDVLEHRGE